MPTSVSKCRMPAKRWCAAAQARSAAGTRTKAPVSIGNLSALRERSRAQTARGKAKTSSTPETRCPIDATAPTGKRMRARLRKTGRSGLTSYAEALAAAAALGHVGIIVAQPPREAFLHQVDARALHVGQAQRIDHEAHAAAFETAVFAADPRHGVDAIAKPRAACRLDRQSHGDGAGTPGELRGEVLRGRGAERNRRRPRDPCGNRASR